MILHVYDYLFAIGTIFAFLDAWNIGANDVANSFSTSVSSRSLTNLQAMCIATVMEFSGSIGVGARVAETIRTKVIDPKLYKDDPAVLMLAMICAVIGSSLYLTAATKAGLPVSTTHSIMGGIIGAGVASVGAKKVSWGWNGVSQVWAAWAIAPGISGAFAAIIFLVTKYCVMERKNPVKMAFYTVPIYFILTSGLMAMLLIWKGASKSIKLSDAGVAGATLGVAFGVGALVVVFFLPWLYRRVVKDDWRVRWYHIPKGPLLLLDKSEVPPPPEEHRTGRIQDYYRGRKTREQLEAERAGAGGNGSDPEMGKEARVSNEKRLSANGDTVARSDGTYGLVGPKPEGGRFSAPVLFWWAKKIVLRGIDKDVVNPQARESKLLSGDVDEMHSHAKRYDNRAEYMYSFLQILTAATASFTHGANDVANAIGPYATIYEVWHTGKAAKDTPVPTWILAFGGASIVVGLWTYGYNIMRNLGNRMTLMSPSRGFSMELGSAITVIMATRLKLPISTTQCITGAIVGVGIVSGNLKGVNWRMVVWIYCGWIITLPVAGLISGCLMGIIINAPRFGKRPF